MSVGFIVPRDPNKKYVFARANDCLSSAYHSRHVLYTTRTCNPVTGHFADEQPQENHWQTQSAANAVDVQCRLPGAGRFA